MLLDRPALPKSKSLSPNFLRVYLVLSLMLMMAGLPAYGQAVPEADREHPQQICSPYGKRYVYITFAQTCVKMDGYIRAEYIQTENHNSPASGQGRYRARINLNEKRETEFGLYTSELRFQADGNSDRDEDAELEIKRAVLGLSGFRLGHTDTFFETHHKDGWQWAGNDGYYSFATVNLFDYTHKINDFSFTIGLQQTPSASQLETDGQLHPDYYVGASYQADWGRIAGTVGYDGVFDTLVGKASLEVNITDALFLHSWYAQSNGKTQLIFGNYSPTNTNGINTRWEWGVDLNYKVSDKLRLWTGFTDAENPSSAPDADLWHVGIGAHWYLTPDFSARPEVIIAGEFEQYRLRFLRSF